MGHAIVPASAPAATTGDVLSVYHPSAFELSQRAAKALASSDLVPQQFRGNVANCLMALDLSNRLRISPMAVLQNLYVIHGRPAWSGQFVIACINACGRFSTLRFNSTDGACFCEATDLATGQLLEGPIVTLAMAKAEGWSTKAGSKWQTMPDLMLRYRAAAFWGRTYCPEALMGLYSADEAADIQA